MKPMILTEKYLNETTDVHIKNQKVTNSHFVSFLLCDHAARFSLVALRRVVGIPISAESHSDANCFDAKQFGSGSRLFSVRWRKVPNHISKRHCNQLDAQNFCSETRFLPEEIKPEVRPAKIPVTSLAL